MGYYLPDDWIKGGEEGTKLYKTGKYRQNGWVINDQLWKLHNEGNGHGTINSDCQPIKADAGEKQ